MLNLILNFIINNFVVIIFLGLLTFVIFSANKRKKQTKEAKKLIAKAIKSGLNEPLTLHPIIDPTLCGGCGACTRVCPEGDILKLVNNRAELVSPSKCVGHGECEKACPMDAIKLVFGTKTRGMDIPRVNSNYETNVPGLYIAGELGGMGLIRNAIKQGVLAATDALKKIQTTSAGSGKTDYDLLIVGAGPAGLAASITAIAEKKSYLCIDQNTLGGTVYHFPRQKIVMSHPFDLPIVGKMKFSNNKVSKEELLNYWNEIKIKTGFKVLEKTKFESINKKDNHFIVNTNAGVFTAKKVILAMGVRGTPRKLNVPGEESSKVTYNLLDPEQYKQKNIVVVGGGNAGVEAAQMLCQTNIGSKVHLLIRGLAFDRCNQDNINRITELEKKGQCQIWFQASVQEILPSQIKIKKNDEIKIIENDFVFVFAGAELPHQFLMSLGIQIDKKFETGIVA